MHDATGQLGNESTKISYLVSGKNGVRFVIEPLTYFTLHYLLPNHYQTFLIILIKA